MHYIGNDVVDLKEAISTLKHNDNRWLDKNFNSIEQIYIKTSTNPAITLWKLWSCKESAYKVIVKKESIRFLNGRRIQIDCTNIQDIFYKIFYKDHTLWVKTSTQENYIHSLCSFSLETINQTRFDILQNNYKTISEKSTFIRKKLREEINTKYGMIEVDFTKNKLGVPMIKTNNLSIQLDISFSHDGAFSAYSFIKRNQQDNQ